MCVDDRGIREGGDEGVPCREIEELEEGCCRQEAPEPGRLLAAGGRKESPDLPGDMIE
jgi:hypothetical protein